MKCVLYDSNAYKFSQGIIDSWVSNGHEVLYGVNYDRLETDDTDIIYFEWCDSNLKWFTNNEPKPKKAKVVVRIIDIDAWAGHPGGVNWDMVDKIIFISPLIQKYVNETFQIPDRVEQKLIPCGVDVDKFTLVDKPDAHSVVWVANDIWEMKGFHLALMTLKALPVSAKLHVRGHYNDNGPYKWYCENYIDKNDLRDRIEFIDSVKDMNEVYHRGSHILLTSLKEAFSYAVAEGMACGLKPTIMRCPGIDELWPKDMIVETPMHATVRIMLGNNDPQSYRDLVSKLYPIDKMMKSINSFLGIQ